MLLLFWPLDILTPLEKGCFKLTHEIEVECCTSVLFPVLQRNCALHLKSQQHQQFAPYLIKETTHL